MRIEGSQPQPQKNVSSNAPQPPSGSTPEQQLIFYLEDMIENPANGQADLSKFNQILNANPNVTGYSYFEQFAWNAKNNSPSNYPLVASAALIIMTPLLAAPLNADQQNFLNQPIVNLQQWLSEFVGYFPSMGEAVIVPTPPSQSTPEQAFNFYLEDILRHPQNTAADLKLMQQLLQNNPNIDPNSLSNYQTFLVLATGPGTPISEIQNGAAMCLTSEAMLQTPHPTRSQSNFLNAGLPSGNYASWLDQFNTVLPGLFPP